MFCSGNVTERMRMGKQKDLKDNVIVDLYCGIGYYTIPFLVYGNIKHIYACEWNPNSIAALRINLDKMKIPSDKYTIYEGDNRLTTTSLSDIADRISLGLLPSSEDGWPLAARILKPSGGMLHVHENVNQDNISNWILYAISKFETYFRNYNKSFRIECIHLEKVKSYAPRIYHVVADLKCTPLEQSNTK